MRYTHAILIIVVAVFCSTPGFTQDTTDTSWKTYPGSVGRTPVSPDTVNNTTVPVLTTTGPGKTQVFKDSRIDTYSNLWTDDEKRAGFRILIYQGKSSEESKQAKTKFLYKFDDQKAYEDYLQPYFRVTVGDFITRLQAEEYLEKLRERYPSAYIIKTDIKPIRLN